MKPDDVKYGYQEIRDLYKQYMSRAIVIAIAIQLLLIGGYYLADWAKPSPKSTRYEGHPIPISLENLKTPPLHEPLEYIYTSPGKLGIGIPVPSSEATIDTNIEFASQVQLSNEQNRGFAMVYEGLQKGLFVISSELTDPIIDTFDIYPKPILTPKPEYPESARKAGLEGTAIVKVLLDEKGRAEKTVLLKVTDTIFAKPSIAAAKKWTFTPPVINGKAVHIWVAIPVRFRLSR